MLSLNATTILSAHIDDSHVSSSRIVVFFSTWKQEPRVTNKQIDCFTMKMSQLTLKNVVQKYLILFISKWALNFINVFKNI
jgi:hypothetical protein